MLVLLISFTSLWLALSWLQATHPCLNTLYIRDVQSFLETCDLAPIIGMTLRKACRKISAAREKLEVCIQAINLLPDGTVVPFLSYLIS